MDEIRDAPGFSSYSQPARVTMEANSHLEDRGSLLPQGELVRETVGGQPYEYRPLGEYVVAAPGVCGGEPTFKYTRINVRYVLERLRSGETAEAILAAYEGRISAPALDEALQLEGALSTVEPARAGG